MLVIGIAAVTLARASAITIARFCPPKGPLPPCVLRTLRTISLLNPCFAKFIYTKANHPTIYFCVVCVCVCVFFFCSFFFFSCVLALCRELSMSKGEMLSVFRFRFFGVFFRPFCHFWFNVPFPRGAFGNNFRDRAFGSVCYWSRSVLLLRADLRWPGDSQRESGRFARIDSQKNPYFHHVRAIRANRLEPAIRNF